MLSIMSLSQAKPDPWRPPQPAPDRLETDRIVLRAWRSEDAAGMLEAINIDRASLFPWLPWPATDNRNLAECTYQIERMRRERERPDNDNFVFGLFDRTTGDALGGTGFHRMSLPWHTAEIGYWVRADRRSQGLCTEAVRGLISWGFRPQDQGGWGLRRLTIFCAALNTASRRVPEKIGLRREVHARGERWIDGIGYSDSLGWGVLAEEWDCGAGAIRPV
jgi:ribosomal-protein-serine acetyltransferase